jgi:hypothetical protein
MWLSSTFSSALSCSEARLEIFPGSLSSMLAMTAGVVGFALSASNVHRGACGAGGVGFALSALNVAGGGGGEGTLKIGDVFMLLLRSVYANLQRSRSWKPGPFF